MKFKIIPYGTQVTLSTADGHYLDVRGPEIQIIAVGKFRGEWGYHNAIPGYAVVKIEKMEIAKERPEMDGYYWAIYLLRDGCKQSITNWSDPFLAEPDQDHKPTEQDVEVAKGIFHRGMQAIKERSGRW